MAESGKKQGGKSKTKKPASFSKDAAATKSAAKKPVAKKKTTAKKTTAKKTTNKKTTNTKKTAPKKITPKKVEQAEKVEKVEKKASGFEEFETLKLGSTDHKLDSKIIIRDVEKETIVEAAPKVEEVEAAPKAIEEPLPVFHPVSQPRKMIEPIKVPAAEIKRQEIEKAVKTATKMPVMETRRKRRLFGEFGLTRVVLAAACITTAVFAVAYFVNTASSDMSLQVAATQSGINAKYPSYIPRGYEVSNVTSSSGKVLMQFKSDEGEFTLTEENSTWDSEALLNNYVKSAHGNDYSVIREQGLTLYTGSEWGAWVNGGMLYKLTITSGSLTKKQIKTIATSL